MNGADIEPGKRYGFRRHQPDPLEEIRVVEKVRPGRWKVEFLGQPHPGLVDYVRSRDLVCKWTDRQAVLRGERRLSRLRDQAEGEWSGEGPYDTAVMYVLDATGEEVGTVRGVLSARLQVFERLWARIEEEAPVGGSSFVDRAGQMHCSWTAVEAFSRQFARAEPKVVLDTIELQEQRLSAGGREPGESWQLDHLRTLGPAFALIRQWVGAEQERTASHAEADRLRRLVQMAIHDLHRLDHDAEATKLERALRGG